MNIILKLIVGTLCVLGLLFLGAVLFAPSENVATSTTTETMNSPAEAVAAEQTTQAPAAEEVKTYVIGDRVVSGNIAYTITNVQTSPTLSNEYSSTSADGIFVIVDMTLENIGKETITMTSNYVKLVDDQARVFESDSDSWMYIDNNNNLLLKQLQPGLQTNGRIVFDVPVGGAYGAMVTGSIWGGDEQVIILGST